MFIEEVKDVGFCRRECWDVRSQTLKAVSVTLGLQVQSRYLKEEENFVHGSIVTILSYRI